MSDKSREEFETWACDKYAVKFFPFELLTWRAQQKKVTVDRVYIYDVY